jgi:sialidase-1
MPAAYHSGVVSRVRPVAAALSIALLCATLGVGLAAPATAQTTDVVVGSPDLSVYAPGAVVAPGMESTVDLFVSNDGTVTRGGPTRYEDRVSTARAASFVVRSGGTPIDVRTGRTPLGVVPPGTSGPVPL